MLNYGKPRLDKFLDLAFTERVNDALGEIKPTPSKWTQLPAHKQRYVEACLGEYRHLG
jgi:hypothetical protein